MREHLYCFFLSLEAGAAAGVDTISLAWLPPLLPPPASRPCNYIASKQIMNLPLFTLPSRGVFRGGG